MAMATPEQMEDRKRLRRHLEREGLTGAMNDTKWRRLFQSLKKIDHLLRFRRKDVRDAVSLEPGWDQIWHVMGGWENIEWLDISARTSHHRGALVPPRIEDHTEDLLEALRTAGVRYSITAEGVRIWGYLRPVA